MAGKKCEVGCTCGRHKVPEDRRRRTSETTKKRWEEKGYRESHLGGNRGKKCKPGCTCKKHISRPRSKEANEKASRAMKALYQDPEYYEKALQRNIDSHTTPEYIEKARVRLSGKRMDGGPVVGLWDSPEGYRMLTAQWGHPLVNKRGEVWEHRKVLYDSVGPGPHKCHWCDIEIDWGGTHSGSLVVDHLDDDPSNNELKNLVPSCVGCNWGRGRHPAHDRFKTEGE